MPRSPTARSLELLRSLGYIAQVVEQAGKDVGAKVDLVDYVRFQLGEGIEKEETDFAAEVAAAVKG